LQAEVELEKFLEKDYVFEDYVSAVEKYDSVAEDVRLNFAKYRKVGFFEIHCEELIGALSRTAVAMKERVLAALNEKHYAFMNQ
jgi:hypothetical protein